MAKKYEQVEVDFTRVSGELLEVTKIRNEIEEKLTNKIKEIEKKLSDVSDIFLYYNIYLFIN